MNSEKPYLRKRILVLKSTNAIRKAAKESMEVMGYVVVAEDGWVVKKFKDGRIERLSELEKSNGPLALD